ncbi:exopolysaccharide biosynthesis polyprenyl glycosylphosphotransferase [Exercitatus varius]|uniref:Exopolysaccharide biosynthesis polyprenyl glycosylphosphotransferase n=1 Tax=Exercitatus varius TaxID=67857 RepID=A0AAW6Q908_9PAST|nr:exopolysaccharide biosynthesis polyprenyl glycosylphosphotransferase [Exercitatus varius]MDG2949979.1 exopolysaccharide biosynthesis polyprenyl glycosylphosphotransferase [Exercitatus varius]
MNKNYISSLILFFADLFLIFLSVFLSVYIRNELLDTFIQFQPVSYIDYVTYPFPYVIITILFAYFGLYYRRYDFWQESFLILKICIISFIVVFSTLALGKNIEYYSRTTLTLTFILSCLLIPVGRIFIKKKLFNIGIWKKKVKVVGELTKLDIQLINSSYTGYVVVEGGDYDALFISSHNITPSNLDKLIETNALNNKEILFVPVLNQYDFTQAILYQNFDSRVNLFTLENKLLSRRNKFIKLVLDYLLTLLFLPIWGAIVLIIAFKMKLEEPKGEIFFLQERLGKDGKIFHCYKFRTMVSDQRFMQQWLIDNPDEKMYYDTYHKYMNDPRVTKLGCFLRKTSLDELPQLFNVLKGEMSLVGNRPYMVTEKIKMDNATNLILAAKPGITGLWQVSGRSDISFDERLKIDSWYIKNWSIWNDIVILFKTIAVVLRRDGAS